MFDLDESCSLARVVRLLDREVKTRASEGAFTQPTRLTLREVWEQWRSEWEALIVSGDRRPRSFQNVRQRLNKWVLPKVGGKQVAELKRVHVVEILNDCRRAGLSPWTIDGVLDAISGLLKYAVDNEIVQRNVARLPKKNKPRVTDRKATYVPSSDEIDAIIAAAEDLQTFLLTLAETGLRDGEGRGLRWGSINWETSRITIDLQLESNGLTLAPLKTIGSKRVVPMTSRLRKALAEHRLASPFKAADDFVFTTASGRGVSYVSARRALQAAIKDAGIEVGEHRFGQHALRHSFASRLLLAGVDVTRVSKLLGHAQVSITLNTYSHVIEERNPAEDGLLEMVELGLAAGNAR